MVRLIASLAKLTTNSGVMGDSETPNHGSRHQVPPVHQNKEHEFERQGNHDRRQHHHPHGKKDAGHHHVDDQKRDVQNKSDNEGGFQLADHKGGNQGQQRNILPVLWALAWPEALTKSARSFSRVLAIMNFFIGSLAFSSASVMEISSFM